MDLPDGGSHCLHSHLCKVKKYMYIYKLSRLGILTPTLPPPTHIYTHDKCQTRRVKERKKSKVEAGSEGGKVGRMAERERR